MPKYRLNPVVQSQFQMLNIHDLDPPLTLYLGTDYDLEAVYGPQLAASVQFKSACEINWIQEVKPDLSHVALQIDDEPEAPVPDPPEPESESVIQLKEGDLPEETVSRETAQSLFQIASMAGVIHMTKSGKNFVVPDPEGKYFMIPTEAEVVDKLMELAVMRHVKAELDKE